MANELANYSDGLRLKLPAEMLYEDWQGLGVPLFAIAQRSKWWLGDWVNHGEKIYGEKYAQGVPPGMTEEYLRVVSWVCNKFGPSRRRESLDFSHHKAVGGLEPAEADRFLDRAERERWPVARLVQEVKYEQLVDRQKAEASRVIETPKEEAVNPFTVSEEKEVRSEEASDDEKMQVKRAAILCHSILEAASDLDRYEEISKHVDAILKLLGY